VSPRLKLIIALLAVPTLGLGWWLGSPLFLDRSVDEAFPVVATSAAEAEPTTAPADAMTDDVTESVGDDMAAEPTGPVAVSTGVFRGADDFHRGTGVATIYDLEDGSRVLRFEGFEVTNGPDLRVLLVPDGDPQVSDDIAGHLELEPLKGNVGDQNYEIPKDLDVSVFGSVVIYCKPFHVLFAVASLEA
jgi:hypothetical protein